MKYLWRLYYLGVDVWGIVKFCWDVPIGFVQCFVWDAQFLNKILFESGIIDAEKEKVKWELREKRWNG